MLQIRMLNRGKGPAVQSLRAQTDKVDYHNEMKKTLESCENLFLRQGEVIDVEIAENGEKIITTALGQKYCTKAIVL